MSWSREWFQTTPGLDGRFAVRLRKSGYREQQVWLDADLWRYHKWPVQGALRLEPDRWDTRVSELGKAWGLPIGLALVGLALALTWLRRRARAEGRVLCSHLPSFLADEHTVTRDVTILFLEKEGARELDAAYFRASTDCIARHGGEVVRTVGEQILAVFPGQAQGARQALRAALEATGQGGAVFAGLHQGPMASATLGTDQRQWTLVGDNINVAARIYGIARKQRTGVLVSPVIREHCAEWRFASRGTFALKGRRQALELFEPLSPPERPPSLPVEGDR